MGTCDDNMEWVAMPATKPVAPNTAAPLAALEKLARPELELPKLPAEVPVFVARNEPGEPPPEARKEPEETAARAALAPLNMGTIVTC